MASVEFRAATRTYPKQPRPAVDRLTMSVAHGELIAVVGPSGSGKSTTLRMLAGLEPCDLGEVFIGSRDVTLAPTRERNVAMVFQTFALYPHMTVAENMAFALKMAGLSNAEIQRRVLDAAAMLDLTSALNRLPKTLSGGQRQRVAMGRAVVREPDVFLLDEPLSNLDAPLRHQMRLEILQLQRRLDVTMFYVTHDQSEALTMGHRVAVMNDGQLQQIAAPAEVYDRPASLFVARFIGVPRMNLWQLTTDGEKAHIGGSSWALGMTGLPNTVHVGVRPEDLAIDESSEVRAIVQRVEVPGAETLLYTQVLGAGDVHATVRLAARAGVQPGDEIGLSVTTERLHIFDANTELRLN